MASEPHGHTVHMTQEQSDRMRQTVQTRLQKCQEQRGQPRAKRDRKDAVSFATQSSLMADMAGEPEPGMSTGTKSDSMVALAVGNPYPPSTTPVKDLEPIALADLKIDTHHTGKVLIVRREAAVVPQVAFSWTIVEDEAGDAERVEAYLHKLKRGDDLLEYGKDLMIKEPYFTINEQGEPTIRIHHPSDLVRKLPENESLFPPKKVNSNGIQRTAEKCKNLGNTALKKREFLETHALYTEGIQLAEKEGDESLARDIYRNRAHVNLTLGRLDEAKSDALAAITNGDDEKSKSLDSKANFRAGTAAYNLGEYEEAQRLFQRALELSPDDKDAKTYLRNIETRLREKATGEYDFAKIQSRLSTAKPRVDAATFSANLEIKESPLGGRGLFATQDIKPGELVLCEKAFHVAWSHEKDTWSAMTYDSRDDEIRVFPAGMTKGVVQKLLNNPSQIPRVMDLYGDYRSIGTELIQSEDGPVVDTFQIHDIVCRNAFGPGPVAGEENVSNASTGLWTMAAYVNHACLSNCKKDYIGDLLLMRATKPIAKGEEITHSYDESSDYDSRQAALTKTWGFTCSCPLCKAESQDTPEVREKRRDLVGQTLAFVHRERPASAKRITIAKAERLAKAINETYDEERYKGLPRTALGPVEYWLEKAKKK